MNYTYSYNLPVGDGVDIYIIDTGIYIEHDEFEGRARDGWVAPGLNPGDINGHGTHVAGLAAGKTYGVAKNATVISVKVGEYGVKRDDWIAGINWVTATTRSTGRPSIACVAITTDSPNWGINDAVETLIAGGVTAVVSGGNGPREASDTSPASAQNVIAVGASNITNGIAPFSNYGRAVNIYAPGVGIRSAWIGAPMYAAPLSGTSMSTGIVAGIAAYFLSQDTSLKPADMRKKIGSTATKKVITGIPWPSHGDLAFNGVSP